MSVSVKMSIHVVFVGSSKVNHVSVRHGKGQCKSTKGRVLSMLDQKSGYLRTRQRSPRIHDLI